MPLVVLAVTLFVVLAAVALMPLTLLQRYRMGTSRRRARGWSATFNAAGLFVSCLLFMAGAAVTSYWVPGALTHAAAGLGAGCLLGIAGLALSRWEAGAAALYYTPNRWLVLTLTLVVATRIVVGFWRSWHAWNAAPDYAAWAAASGAAGSLAAGAVVLGYYLSYWLGVRRRVRRHSRVSRRSA